MKNYLKSLNPFRLLAFTAVILLALLTFREVYRHYTIIRCTEDSVDKITKTISIVQPDSMNEATPFFELPYRACMGRAGLDSNY